MSAVLRLRSGQALRLRSRPRNYAALDIARERELARVYANLAELRAGDEEANARGAAVDVGGSDPEGAEQQVAESQERMRERLLSARRLLLAMISGEPEQRAPWKVLAGPVDWEKATRLQPQDNEPFTVPNMRQADMILAAESGLLHDVVGAGRNLSGEIEEGLEEFLATGSMDGPKVRRLYE